MATSELDLCYCAGVFDAAGSLLLSKGSKNVRKPRIAVQLTEPGPMNKMASVFGGTVRQRSSPSRGGRTPISVWEIEGHRAVNAVEQMLPYLVIRRRRSLADILLRYPFLESGKRLSATQSHERAMTIDRLHRIMVRTNKARQARISLKQKRTTQPTPEDYAYLAGLLDAQGSIREAGSVSTSRYALGLISTDIELIKWLWNRFGGNAYPDYRKSRNPNHRSCAAWQCSVTTTRGFAAEIVDLMQNKEKAKALSHWQTHVLPRGPREDNEKDVRVPSRWGDMFR